MDTSPERILSQLVDTLLGEPTASSPCRPAVWMLRMKGINARGMMGVSVYNEGVLMNDNYDWEFLFKSHFQQTN